MKINCFAKKVAISMTLDKICPTRISEVICFYIPSILLSRLERQKIKTIDLLGLLLWSPSAQQKWRGGSCTKPKLYKWNTKKNKTSFLICSRLLHSYRGSSKLIYQVYNGHSIQILCRVVCIHKDGIEVSVSKFQLNDKEKELLKTLQSMYG